MGKKNKIPEGWLDYQPMKEVIRHARIVPFKTPLPVSRFANIPDQKWSPEDVIERVENLGLVIDLTAKYPAYYEVDEFRNNNVHYKKLECTGQVIPSEEVYQEFRFTVDTYLRRNEGNSRVIGVHCTHGVNRTGYLICRYLVEAHDYTPQGALNMFARCRGHAMERENYIEGILHIPPPYMPPPPPLLQQPPHRPYYPPYDNPPYNNPPYNNPPYDNPPYPRPTYY